jgi:magnesium transporter
MDNLGVDLHPSALDHLTRVELLGDTAFPRLERHDNYLFGTFYLPSNTQNSSADFDAIVFVATHDAVVAAFASHATSTRDWVTTTRELSEIDSTDSTPDGGQFILNVLRLVVSEQLQDAQSIRTFLRERSSVLAGRVDLTLNMQDLHAVSALSTKERREALREVYEVVPTVSGIIALLPVMRRVAIETSRILEGVVADDPSRDLHEDLTGNRRELFSRHLEIYLVDYFLESRQLLAIFDEISALSQAISDRARSLSVEENVAAGRFTGAIASIMLLPTFIVGLYGQNFADMPETDWHYGYLFSWGSIVLLTLFQIWFFKRRRWI